MKLVLKHKVEISLLFIFIAVYFLLRLPNLTLQPIFADEAIYIRWAQVMKSEPTLRFLPLSDGKTPLFMWAMMLLFKIFEDPLFAGRFLSIISGLFTLAGVSALSWKVFGKKVAFWASLIYIVVPYTVFFDRMALVDSMLAAFTIWGIYFAIYLAQSPRLDLAMILGFILGGGILTKTPGMINLLLIPLSILAFKKEKIKQHSFIKLITFWVVTVGIAFIMYNLLRLGPNFHLLSSRNADYIFAPLELVGRPLDPFIPHLRDISDWFPKLLTWPILIIGGIGMVWTLKSRNKLGILVLLWMLVPLLLSMTFLRTFTARYLLSSIPLFLILVGFGLVRIFEKVKLSYLWKILISLIIILPYALLFDYQLITNPPPTFLPKAERIGYFEEWTAGYGFKDISKYLLDRKKQGSVVVGTEGFFGTLPDGLQIYLDKANIPIIGSTASISAQIREASLENQTFFVANKSRFMEHINGLKLIREYPKAKREDGSQDAIQLFEVVGEND